MLDERKLFERITGWLPIAKKLVGQGEDHVRIRVAGAQCTIEDLGSKNGTWKNEERLTTAAELHDGDRLRFGALVLTFRSTEIPDTTTAM